MYKINFIVVLLSIILLSNCKQKVGYFDTVEKELAKDIRNDDLFLGLKLTMTSQDFYDTCWGLNKRGLTREGAMNTTVHYPVDELKEAGSLDFYPLFEDGKVKSMTGYTQYKAWAPWRKDLWAEPLLEDTKEWFQRWFGGNEFFQIKSPGMGKAYVKIDGNRRIVLYYLTDQRVEVLISDLTNLDEVLKLKEKE